MERSLSVLLPVLDVQSTLTATVSELLEVLPELTRHFELLIIDDGSQDATIEVADELATHYPQIRVVRHGQTRGRAAAIKTGLQESRGEVVFLRDADCRLPLDEIGRLWRAMDHHDVVLGCPQSIAGPKWNRWKDRGATAVSGCQMVHRKAIEPIQDVLAEQTSLRARLERLGHSWHEVEIRNRRPYRRSDRPVSGITMGQTPHAVPATAVAAAEVVSRPKAPNYLVKVKDRTFGE